MGEGDSAWRCALRGPCPRPNRPDRRDLARRPRGDGGGRIGPAADFASVTAPNLDTNPQAAAMAERRDRSGILRRRARELAGTQFDAAWCDELAKLRYAEATFDTLQFGLRLGVRPRQLITTTPRPLALLKRLLVDPRTRVTRAPTQANKDHLSPAFLDTVVARYAGTRLGRQELDGELIEDRPDALWSRALIEGMPTCTTAYPRSRRRRRRSAGHFAAGCGCLRHCCGGPRRQRLALCS